VTTDGHYPRIVGADEAAQAAGVRAGMLVATAYALAPDLVMRARDPAAEAHALATVATWATQFTPGVSIAPPTAVLIEIGGSLQLFRGLAALRARLQQGICDLGYALQLAIAPTAMAALLFARADRAVTITQPEALLDALDPLPLALLDSDPGSIATLAAAGVTTFGAACALPRAALARRTGTALLDALDRARGRVADPRPLFVSPARYRGRLELPSPVHEADALVFAVRRLVVELAGWLLGHGLGVLEIELALEHEHLARRSADCPATRVRFSFAVPTREAAHLIGVLRERLVRVALAAPVQRLLLESVRCIPLAGRNLGLLPGDGDHPPVPLLDRLRARLGENAVTRIAVEAEHRPERAWSSSPLRCVGDDDAKERRDSKVFASRKSGRPRVEAPSPRPSPVAAAPRPVWLFNVPQPLGDRLVARPWVLRDGPERIESGWWDGNDLRRDYFVAESPSGERGWVYRDGRCGFGDGDGQWFIHGLFA
jgi:protein ImuB